MNFTPEKCERCGGSLLNADGHKEFAHSMFNLERICMQCKKKEREHPKYKEALDAVRREESRGNREYEGIGCPPELYPNKNGGNYND